MIWLTLGMEDYCVARPGRGGLVKGFDASRVDAENGVIFRILTGLDVGKTGSNGM